MPACEECYSDKSRITPLLNPLECLEKHTQYICGTCGRCVCIECASNRGLRRYNFPFKTIDTAKLYLRTADHVMKRPCGIYEVKSKSGRISYKIFADDEERRLFLAKNRDKTCGAMPVFTAGEYRENPKTQVRRLTPEEIKKYMSEQ